MFIINIKNLIEYEINFLLEFLDADEKNRIKNAIRTVSDEFIACRAFSKKILSDALKKPLEDIKFKYLEKGKPYVENEDNLHFNISHSHGIALLALHNNNIGVDIEKKREICDIENIMQAFMFPHEIEWICKTNMVERFFTMWTTKEAILKNTGNGITSDNLPSITIDEYTSTLIHQDFKIYNFSIDKTHCASICVS